MERAILLEHLEVAREYAEKGRLYIARQKQGIAALAAASADTSDAERILQILEMAQSCHLADMQRILNELDDTCLDS